MSNPLDDIRDADLKGVGPALRRASARAREIGRLTKTPVLILREGKIVDLLAEDEPNAVIDSSPAEHHSPPLPS